MKSENPVLNVDEVKQALRVIYTRRAQKKKVESMVCVVVDRDGSVYEIPATVNTGKTLFPDKVCGQWLTVSTPMRLIGHLPGPCKQFHKCKWNVSALVNAYELANSIASNKMKLAQKLMDTLEAA